MGDKYIIEKHEKDSIWRMYADAYGDVTIEGVALTPYTEPDIEKAREEAYAQGYSKGFTNAKVQCNIQAEKDLREVGERHYQKGLSDAWEAARKIAVSVPLGGMSQLAIKRMFGVEWQYVLMNCTPAKVIEKLRQYEQKQEEIQVGDEVVVDSGKCVVLAVDKNGFPAKLLEPDGYTLTLTTDVKLPKTGRHYPQIAEVLAKMKEES